MPRPSTDEAEDYDGLMAVFDERTEKSYCSTKIESPAFFHVEEMPKKHLNIEDASVYETNYDVCSNSHFDDESRIDL